MSVGVLVLNDPGIGCINGRHEGEAGLIVKVDGDVATVFSDVSKEEFVVFMHDLVGRLFRTETMSSADVESSLPPPRVCTSSHLEGTW